MDQLIAMVRIFLLGCLNLNVLTPACPRHSLHGTFVPTHGKPGELCVLMFLFALYEELVLLLLKQPNRLSLPARQTRL